MILGEFYSAKTMAVPRGNSMVSATLLCDHEGNDDCGCSADTAFNFGG
jgi:hypothetical protein